jgi:hypothetical protein
MLLGVVPGLELGWSDVECIILLGH